ncbi:class I SAM-dependent methyltransferase [bacterium]|nr:class I SAM-dependent methyltransferase [bacterium]
MNKIESFERTPFFHSRSQIEYYDKAVVHPESRYFKLIYEILSEIETGNESFLDIGSGTGVLGNMMKDVFKRVDLVDSSPVMCELSRKKNDEFSNIFHHNCNFETFVPPVKQYDLITSIHVAGGYFLEEGFIRRIMEMKNGPAVFFLLKPYNDKFYSDELYPLLFSEKKEISSSKFKIRPFVENLLDCSVDFELRNIELELVQEFVDFDEALNFWMMYLPEKEFDIDVLKKILLKKLNFSQKKYFYKNTVKSTVIKF